MPNVSFQKTINPTIAPGQPGNKANKALENVVAYLAMTDVIPGTFVINMDTLETNPSATTPNSPKKAGYSTGAATGIVAGLVTRDSVGVIPNLYDAYQNIINAGLNIQVASKGEYMVHLTEISGGTAKLGMQVTVPDHTTGVPVLAADGTEGALDWWLCEILDAASGLGVISSWRKC